MLSQYISVQQFMKYHLFWWGTFHLIFTHCLSRARLVFVLAKSVFLHIECFGSDHNKSHLPLRIGKFNRSLRSTFRNSPIPFSWYFWKWYWKPLVLQMQDSTSDMVTVTDRSKIIAKLFLFMSKTFSSCCNLRFYLISFKIKSFL